MSQRTDAALAALDRLSTFLADLPDATVRERLTAHMDALRRAVAAFHMEAIRFRMYSVDRDLRNAGDPPLIRSRFEELRHALEALGFQTRSISAP